MQRRARTGRGVTLGGCKPQGTPQAQLQVLALSSHGALLPNRSSIRRGPHLISDVTIHLGQRHAGLAPCFAQREAVRTSLACVRGQAGGVRQRQATGRAHNRSDRASLQLAGSRSDDSVTTTSRRRARAAGAPRVRSANAAAAPRRNPVDMRWGDGDRQSRRAAPAWLGAPTHCSRCMRAGMGPAARGTAGACARASGAAARWRRTRCTASGAARSAAARARRPRRPCPSSRSPSGNARAQRLARSP